MTDREHDALEALHEIEAQIEDTAWQIDERVFSSGEFRGQQATLGLEYTPETVPDPRDCDGLKAIIADIGTEYGKGAPLSEIVARATDELDMDGKEARDAIESLRRNGDVYEPTTDHLRVV